MGSLLSVTLSLNFLHVAVSAAHMPSCYIAERGESVRGIVFCFHRLIRWESLASHNMSNCCTLGGTQGSIWEILFEAESRHTDKTWTQFSFSHNAPDGTSTVLKEDQLTKRSVHWNSCGVWKNISQSVHDLCLNVHPHLSKIWYTVEEYQQLEWPPPSHGLYPPNNWTTRYDQEMALLSQNTQSTVILIFYQFLSAQEQPRGSQWPIIETRELLSGSIYRWRLQPDKLSQL